MKTTYMTYKELVQEQAGERITYNDLLYTLEWRNKREEILSRDGNKCTKCNKFSTVPHFDDESREWYHLWFGEEKLELVKGKDGKFTHMLLPEVEVSEDAFHMHVHHRFYILNRLPWEYENEALVTLCNWCHWDLHENEHVEVFFEDGETNAQFDSCKRCNGAGWFPEYSHVEAGVCFRCRGSRYEQELVTVGNR